MSLKCQMNEWKINVCISNIIPMINEMKWNETRHIIDISHDIIIHKPNESS